MPKIPSLPSMTDPADADLFPVEDSSVSTTKKLTFAALVTWLKNQVHDTGDVKMTAQATAPTGWMICDGSAISRTTYATLFAAIGTAFGAGDASTTFNIPDFRDRFPMGKSGTKALGSTGGAATINLSHTHSTPNHAHSLATYNTAGGRSSAGATGYKSGGAGGLDLVSGSGGETWSLVRYFTDTTGGGTTGSALSSSQSVLNPYQAINYIIKL